MPGVRLYSGGVRRRYPSISNGPGGMDWDDHRMRIRSRMFVLATGSDLRSRFRVWVGPWARVWVRVSCVRASLQRIRSGPILMGMNHLLLTKPEAPTVPRKRVARIVIPSL